MAVLDRRKFLVRAIAAMGAAIGAMLGVPAIGYLIGPSQSEQSVGEWVPLGSSGSVPPGPPELLRTTIERKVGWMTETSEISVFVTTTDGEVFKALSNICTHLGCRVRYVEDQAGYFCPCHNAVFDLDGEVVTGPPPAPLAEYETRVEDGTIYIREGSDGA